MKSFTIYVQNIRSGKCYNISVDATDSINARTDAEKVIGQNDLILSIYPSSLEPDFERWA